MTRWIILRTSAGQTLALAASLAEAGCDVWTPAKIVRRSMPAKTPSGKRIIESEIPILPTFVFARDHDLDALAAAATTEQSPHPPFSVFRHGGRVPLVGDCEVLGLRDEEAREAALIQALHDAENHAEAERLRIEAIRSASARRRAELALERQQRAELRAQGSAIAPGAHVEVIGVPAMVGITGILQRADGHYVHVAFGRSSWKIEGWRVMPSLDQAPRSSAA